MNFDLILSSISRHISLTPDEAEFFTSLWQGKTLKAGDFLLREGDVCWHETFVVKGCLKTYYQGDDVSEHIIDFSIEEWWADDLHSFFTQTPSRLAIKAIEDTEVLQISKNNLEILYRKITKFERFFRIVFQNAYIAQREQINQALSASAEERYLLFVKKKPYAEKRFSQKDIASYLGVTPQFLSTLKKKLGKVNVD
ncbi:Crp/Fnr family transcriptional regulator [Terrimonas sp. NA20]|uniref:Crp/Fnr family transcriptional regulator n=1 Tax=Terrimonas ginsenosidimutans TaxID=2908004 RepID=A0ABS9KSC5_9BACT|nr:Crp/Fnr family transcriptional regulator [Terrimonas ginsenosidimutans]MCG2615231.1 Crp/Fnr family transcriptional regulator [Terrimonas ginsenosidimutans]